MTDTVAARMLDAGIRALRVDILPHLDNEDIRIRFDQITRLLRGVSARLTTREEGLRDLINANSQLVDGIAVSPGEFQLEELEKQRLTLEQKMCDLIPEWLEDAKNTASAIKSLEKMVADEKKFFLSQDADVASGSQVVYRGGRIDQEALQPADEFPPINDETITGYLRSRLNRDNICARKVRTVPGGFSKYTAFFNLVDEADASQKNLVIRKDMRELFLQKSVVTEYPVLEKLHALGFPVARPVWLEPDRTLFGGCFMVSEQVDGTNDSTK